MEKPFTAAAVTILTRRARTLASAGDFDPALWFPFIMAVLDKLLDCAPTPDDGYDYLTWRPRRRPLIDWLANTTPAERLRAYRRKVTAAMRRQWLGTAAEFDVFAAAMWEAVDGGDVTRLLVKGLYGEAGK
jgi:hypothetical protein